MYFPCFSELKRRLKAEKKAKEKEEKLASQKVPCLERTREQKSVQIFFKLYE